VAIKLGEPESVPLKAKAVRVILIRHKPWNPGPYGVAMTAIGGNQPSLANLDANFVATQQESLTRERAAKFRQQ
jgi:hypothetical protein